MSLSRNIDLDERATVGIINFGAGNIFSVKNACEVNEIPYTIIEDLEGLKSVDCLILPGVGSFQHAVMSLKKMNFWEPLIEHVRLDKPLLGICLGMQLLFKESAENGITEGLNVFDQAVCHFEKFNSSNDKLKIPHMGWTEVNKCEKETDLFQNINEPFEAYFAHSFMIDDIKVDYIIGNSEHNKIKFCSAVQKSNVYGVQFHPEKSADKGLLILSNFYKKCENWRKDQNDKT